ncbi:MAG: class I SAM-dependent methyltransferase [Bacteroidota bacterium]|jgi:2-polyprenyl-3-methyl-5-hydroxy-6-metoxy-1,4-benzoquinol methylase
MKYRQTLYTNYHSTQSGRASLTDAKQLFEREVDQFDKEIIPLLSTVAKSAKVFDLGCGSGSLLQALSNVGFNNISGMDLSKEQVELAHSLGVNCVEMGNGLEFLEACTHTYDVILGMDIIEHFTKDELVELLQTIKRALTPNGIVIFRTPNLDSPMASVFANGDFTHENYLNASSAQQVLLATGFNNVQILSSFMQVKSIWKELLRKIIYQVMLIRLKLQLFATARSTRNIVFTPNMIIIASNQ